MYQITEWHVRSIFKLRQRPEEPYLDLIWWKEFCEVRVPSVCLTTLLSVSLFISKLLQTLTLLVHSEESCNLLIFLSHHLVLWRSSTNHSLRNIEWYIVPAESRGQYLSWFYLILVVNFTIRTFRAHVILGLDIRLEKTPQFWLKEITIK